MKSRPLQIALVALVVSTVTCLRPATAQESGTLDVLRSLPLDSLEGAIEVYYSPGHRDRAAGLQRMQQEALAFYEDSLGQDFETRLAVLDDEHWTALGGGAPYGLPWYAYRGAVPVVVMPASTDHGVVIDMLRPRWGDEAARRGLAAVGFHELGHVILQEYLYPDDSLRTPPVRWFDELMATYVGQGYLWLTQPGALDQALGQSFGDARPPLTSLGDFEANYWNLNGSDDGRNYGWYQGQFSARAAQVFEARGLDFLRQLKEYLPWGRLDAWTSEDLLGRLERIEPGFEAWAATLKEEPSSTDASLPDASSTAASADAFEAPVSFVSEGDTLRGTMFVAEGAGPHPTVLFFTGFPGSAESPYFLEPMHEAGANVMYFNYRGTWKSDGLFSLDHALADAEAALAFVRSPEARTAYRVDPDAVVAYGISFGGWAALSLAAREPSLECVAARVVSNIGAFGRQWGASEPFRAAWRRQLDQITANLPIRLVGGVDGAMTSITTRADAYDVARQAPALEDRTIILLGAEDDEVAPMALSYQPVADALRGTGMDNLTLMTAPGGHEDVRPAWDATLVRWLYDDCLDERYRPADLDQTLAALEGAAEPVSIAEIVYRTMETDGIEAARAQHRALRAASPDSIDFGEDAVQTARDPLNVLGYRLLQAGRVPEAVAVFEMNAEAYPNEPNPYDSLGDGYREAGRLEDAQRSYERAIELAGPGHPNMDTYRANLERVTRQLEKK